MSRGLLALYWPAREDSFEFCAAAAAFTLRSLGDVGFKQFRQRGRSRRQAEKRIFEPTDHAVAALLRKGVNRSDVDRQPIPDLGWSLSLWSGHSDRESFAVSVQCGCHSPRVGNCVVVNFPREGPLVLPSQVAPARRLYAALLEFWKPEQATLCDGEIHWVDRVLSPLGERWELLQREAPRSPERPPA